MGVYVDSQTNLVSFGKYNGKHVDELKNDRSYCQWLLKTYQTSKDSSFIKFIDTHIQPKTPSKKAIASSSKAYYVEGVRYSSVKKATEHIRTLLETIGYCESVKSCYPAEYLRLIDIFKQHPNPEVVELVEQAVDIEIVQLYNGMKGHHVKVYTEENGEGDFISWIKCVTQKTSTPRELLIKALRWSVEPQIQEFRVENPEQTCSFCDTTEGPFHVDHVVQFKSLTINFLKGKKESEIPLTFSEDQYKIVFKEENRVFEREWVEYHRENSELRWLCSKCNLTRPKES